MDSPDADVQRLTDYHRNRVARAREDYQRICAEGRVALRELTDAEHQLRMWEEQLDRSAG